MKSTLAALSVQTEILPPPDSACVIQQTQQWLERLVLAKGLCPFAYQPYQTQRIRYFVSTATQTTDLLADLLCELRLLDTLPARQLETTLLIHPAMLHAFPAYNAFLATANALLQAEGFQGIIQIASFHPEYCFAGVDAGDASHYTNRSPWPMLHLIREDSLAHAVAHYPDVAAIPQRNIACMQQMGTEALQALMAAIKPTIQQG